MRDGVLLGVERRRRWTDEAKLSILGEVGANIVELDVLERSVSTAVDQLLVEAPGLTGDEVRAALEGVEGTEVELLRPTRRNVGMPPLGLAVRLGRTSGDEALQTLVDGVVLSFEATWAAVVASRTPQPLVRAASAGAPSFLDVHTPWLPLRDVRRLPQGPWTPESWLRAGEPLEPLFIRALEEKPKEHALLQMQVGGLKALSQVGG